VSSTKFYDLMFEISNEHRHNILLLLNKEAMRVTSISNELDLTTPEISRHISRLSEIGLVSKDVDGFYNLTPLGTLFLVLLREFEFISKHTEYFASHKHMGIPVEYLKRIGDISESSFTGNIQVFFHQIEQVIKEARKEVWLLVDQFPLNHLSFILKALERGVRFRILEPRNRIINPDLEALALEESQTFTRMKVTPLVEQRMLDEVNLFMYISEKDCAVAFPNLDGENEYKGFKSKDETSLEWCRDLFEYYWYMAEQRTVASLTKVERGRISKGLELSGRIVVTGQERPDIDAQAVQDAVDNYDEVILRGRFNFGSAQVQLSKSVIIKGEGRENDIPQTSIFKKGWNYPFTEWDCVFYINGEDADVTIENLRFTDFNCACIWGVQGNSLRIINNSITLLHGYGRGATFGALGDWIVGIEVDAKENCFRGGVIIDGNYIDFSSPLLSIADGHVSRGGLEEDPEYRPNLLDHEYFVTFGITTWNLPGSVGIENNIVRNANARGITTSNNLPSADVKIRHNTITSDVYGSYPFSSHEAGAGILAQSTFSGPGPGFNVEIEDNTIKLDKLNYSGIIVLGPVTDREGADKLRGGVIRNNCIQLRNGYEGIHVRKCDDFEVTDNKITGEVYYGIRISGRKRTGELDLRALNNLVEGNDMDDMRIREPDDYSDNHVDGRRFAGSTVGSFTAHIWLDKFSERNVVEIRKNEKVIDEGKENTIEYY